MVKVEVEREEGEVKEKRSCMTVNVDGMRLKNPLSLEMHVTTDIKRCTETARAKCLILGTVQCL